MLHTEHKGFKLEDLDAEGKVRAKIATLQVIDKDRDVTLPGFFGRQATRMVWSHKWDHWIGKGAIFEEGAKAVFEGQFFMNTAAGQEAFKSVEAMGELAEWSYGFDLKADGWSAGEWDGQQVRLLKPTADNQPGARINEVSPVLVGAGEGTGTLALKGANQDLTFVDELLLTVAEVKASTARGQAIAAMRAEKGKQLGEQAMELLSGLAVDLKELQSTLEALQADPEPDGDDDDPEVAQVNLAAAEAYVDQLLAGIS